jgi:hypothetical protein
MPVFLATRVPGVRNRLTVGFRFILVIPQAIVLALLEVAALFVAILGWVGALVTGRLPGFARDFLSGFVRWSTRFYAYGYLLTDDYPPFSMEVEEQYPIQLAVPPAAPLNRLAVLVRFFLALPALVVTTVLGMGAELFAVVGWFAIVFSGEMPPAIFEALRSVLRYQARTWSYLFMLTTEYPAQVLGDTEPSGAVDEAWLIRLSPQGRTSLTILIVLGVVFTIFNDARLF